MGQQTKKIIKRRRRADYLKRKAEIAKLGGTVKRTVVAKVSVNAAAKPEAAKKAPAKKAAAKKAPAKKAVKAVVAPEPTETPEEA